MSVPKTRATYHRNLNFAGAVLAVSDMLLGDGAGSSDWDSG